MSRFVSAAAPASAVETAARRPASPLEAVDLHGAHDFRHTFSTWLEDAGVPAESSTS